MSYWTKTLSSFTPCYQHPLKVALLWVAEVWPEGNSSPRPWSIMSLCLIWVARPSSANHKAILQQILSWYQDAKGNPFFPLLRNWVWCLSSHWPWGLLIFLLPCIAIFRRWQSLFTIWVCCLMFHLGQKSRWIHAEQNPLKAGGLGLECRFREQKLCWITAHDLCIGCCWGIL